MLDIDLVRLQRSDDQARVGLTAGEVFNHLMVARKTF
jgi:hypothetical protein